MRREIPSLDDAVAEGVRHLPKILLLMLVFGLVFYGLIVLFGSTFGQRCEQWHSKNTPEWHRCVDDLARGLEYNPERKR